MVIGNKLVGVVSWGKSIQISCLLTLQYFEHIHLMTTLRLSILTAKGTGCARAQYPGVNARVSSAYDWIQNQICCLSANPPSGCTCVDDGTATGGGVGSGSGGGGGGTSLGCFSKDSTVFTTKGEVQMKNLQVGDEVLTGSGLENYEPIYAFGHIEPRVVADFIEISFESVDSHGSKQDHSIEMTDEHLIYLRGETHPIRAGAVQVGNILVGLGGGLAKVTKLSSIRKEGVYAPLTASGKIVVNGLVVSTYVSLQKEADMYSQVGKGGWLRLPLSQHDISHFWMAPLRIMCSASSADRMAFCETHDDNGFLHWVSLGMRTVEWGQQQNFLVQVLLLASMVTVFGSLALAEYMLSSFGCGVALALFSVIGLNRALNRSSLGNSISLANRFSVRVQGMKEE